jgi:hypothetical protein
MNNLREKRIQENEEMVERLNEFTRAAMMVVRDKAKRELDDYVRELIKK